MNVHPKVAMIAFNLACYASVTGRMEDAKERLRNAIGLSDREIARRTGVSHSFVYRHRKWLVRMP